MIKTLILLASIASLANAQVIGLGSCPSVSYKTNVNITQSSGKWYVSERYENLLEKGKCAVHNLVDLTFGLTSTTMSTDVNTNVESTYIGLMAPIGQLVPGHYLAIYPTAEIPIPIPFGVVNTDYKTYAVVYYCLDLSIAHMKYGWILTRDKIANSTVSNAAYAVMDLAKMDRTILKKIDHTTCAANH